MDYEYEIVTIEVNIDQVFEKKFLRFDNDLSILCRRQKVKGNLNQFRFVLSSQIKDADKRAIILMGSDQSH